MTTKMRPLRETVSLNEARARIDAAVRPIDRTERVPLADANPTLPLHSWRHDLVAQGSGGGG